MRYSLRDHPRFKKYAINNPQIIEKIKRENQRRNKIVPKLFINKIFISSYFCLWLKFIFHELKFIKNIVYRNC